MIIHAIENKDTTILEGVTSTVPFVAEKLMVKQHLHLHKMRRMLTQRRYLMSC